LAGVVYDLVQCCGIQAGGGTTVNRADLQRLAKERIADAKALLAARRWSAAYYMAGYAVECALNACIAKLMKSEEFPDKKFAEKCWTHNLTQLVDLAGLEANFDAALRADPDLRKKLGYGQGMERGEPLRPLDKDGGREPLRGHYG
jgi:hypothetical protein